MVFSSSTTIRPTNFVEWQYIHVHFTASDPLEKSWGRKLEVAQFSPDQEPLGRNTGISILEHITTV